MYVIQGNENFLGAEMGGGIFPGRVGRGGKERYNRAINKYKNYGGCGECLSI
jgi:hypothetical protein